MRPLLLVLLVLAAPAAAQGSYDQRVVGELLEREAPLPAEPVRYAVYRVEHPSGNSVLARHALYRRRCALRRPACPVCRQCPG